MSNASASASGATSSSTSSSVPSSSTTGTSSSSSSSAAHHVFAEDMTEAMRAQALDVGRRAFQTTVSKGKVYGTIAATIRDHFDKHHRGGGGVAPSGRAADNGGGGGGWNCVVGKSFGTCVTHEMKKYMYFSVVPGVNVLLWKA